MGPGARRAVPCRCYRGGMALREGDDVNVTASPHGPGQCSQRETDGRADAYKSLLSSVTARPNGANLPGSVPCVEGAWPRAVPAVRGTLRACRLGRGRRTCGQHSRLTSHQLHVFCLCAQDGRASFLAPRTKQSAAHTHVLLYLLPHSRTFCFFCLPKIVPCIYRIQHTRIACAVVSPL